MEEADFFHVVKVAWKKEVRSVPPDCRFRDRMKNFKTSIRIWSKDRFGMHRDKIEEAKNEATRWELEAKKRTYVKGMGRKGEGMWRNNKCNLRGLMVNEVWCEDPRIDKISEEDTRSLEKVFSEGELWDAIRGCEGIKPRASMVSTSSSLRSFRRLLKRTY
ncbi:hypothetical protein Tco_0187065 [Tanacetum coccineum]